MKIIAFIEDIDIIRMILKHLDLCETRNHGPPPVRDAQIPDLIYDYDYAQLPFTGAWVQCFVNRHTGQMPPKSVKMMII